jgi:hypothetical protein
MFSTPAHTITMLNTGFAIDDLEPVMRGIEYLRERVITCWDNYFWDI